MTDLSNKTLAVLIGLVLAVSLVGTWAVLNKVSIGITGADYTTSGTGTAYADVSSHVGIVMKATIINFSAVDPGASKDSASDAIAGQRFFTIENNGTVKCNVTQTAAASIWDSLNVVDSDFQIYAADNESTSARTYLGTSGAPLNITASPQKLIDTMEFDDDKDLVNIFIKIHVPTDEASGAKSESITFSASQA